MTPAPVAVLRPRPPTAAGRTRAGLDVLRLEAYPDAVVAVDGRGRARRFPRDGGEGAPSAVGVVDDDDVGPAVYPGLYLALLDGQDRALAWHTPVTDWDEAEVEAFAERAGLRHVTVHGRLRSAPGGVDLRSSPATRVVAIAFAVGVVAAAVLGATGLVPWWLAAFLPVLVPVAAGLALRYLPAPSG